MSSLPSPDTLHQSPSETASGRHKCVLLWPVFWGITFFCFLSNTYRVRHTTLRQTLADFRADNQKTKLLKIFENNDVP
jgi:hypothetical protein